MPIAAFYENIRTGALEKGISMTEAVSRLRESGMDGIYICLDSVREYPDEIEEVIRTTGVCVTGLHAWIDFGRNPEGYQELVDAAVRLKTDHVLIVPTCEDEEEPLPVLLCGMRKAVLYGKDRGIRVLALADCRCFCPMFPACSAALIPETLSCIRKMNWKRQSCFEISSLRCI